MSLTCQHDDRPDTDIRAENACLKTQVMNLMGKLEVRENFVPRLTMDLASEHKLELMADEAGCLAKFRPMYREGLGS